MEIEKQIWGYLHQELSQEEVLAFFERLNEARRLCAAYDTACFIHETLRSEKKRP